MPSWPRHPCEPATATQTSLLMAIIGIVLFAPATHALDHVVGDSLSLLFNEASPSWPELVFGDAVANHSVRGAGSAHFTESCQQFPCGWANGATDDVWWILLGNNDHVVNTTFDATIYRDNLSAIADLIETRNGAADVRLVSSPYSFDAFDIDRSRIREFRDDQALIDAMLCDTDPRFTCAADLRIELAFPEHFRSDGVHLSDAGVRAVAALIPEPTTGLLVGLGLGVLSRARRARPHAVRRSARRSTA